jgi:prolyl 4-hydroxylase
MVGAFTIGMVLLCTILGLYWHLSLLAVEAAANQVSHGLTDLGQDIHPTKKIDILSWAPRVLVHHHFLSSAECDYIVKLASGDVSRSGVTGEGGEVLYTDYRTSYGAFITKHMKDPVVQTLANRIEEWTQIPKEHGEDFYLLRYQIGQEYKPHTDWFAGDEEGLKFLGTAGNRLATVIVYLSDVEEGGETHFPRVNLKVRPSKGDALLFWNRTPDFVLDPLALHSSLPVVRGTKWSITRWIRERPV